MRVSVLAATLASLLIAAPVFAGSGEDPAAATSGVRADAEVTWQVIFRKGDRTLGAPTVGSRFGRQVMLEVPEAMRVTMVADAPGVDGRAHAVARMAVFRNGEWQPEKRMEMRAVLSQTPSFEYAVSGTDYRFVVIPRLGPAAAT